MTEKTLRVEQFVALLPPLQPLDSLAMHLLGHLVVALLLLLGGATVLDLLDMGLHCQLGRTEDRILVPVARTPAPPSSPFHVP